jgi:predicted transcriptional regulator
MTITLSPSRQAELEQFAQQHGQTITDALDDAVATYLELQGQHFDEDVAAIQEAIEDLHAGRSVSLEEFDANMRQRYDIPR